MCLEQITVIDFNPNVFRTLTDRGLHVVYGDISNVDTLVHAGIGKAELIILQRAGLAAEGAPTTKSWFGTSAPSTRPPRSWRRRRRWPTSTISTRPGPIT
mgnify:CR=1 FL=1